MKLIKVTLDTSVLPANDLIELCKSLPLEIKVVTVTERELEGSDIQVGLKILEPIPEIGVWDESKFDECVFGSKSGNKSIAETFIVNESIVGKGKIGNAGDGDQLELILRLISNGSFPKKGKRETLTKNERHQLRDAMIFQAHAREKRQIFVSDDNKGFIGKGGKIRLALEQEFDAKILTRKEFVNLVSKNPEALSSLA